MEYKNKLFKMKKSRERESRIEQGFFDGRFRSQRIPNKKKDREKKISSHRFYNEYFE